MENHAKESIKHKVVLPNSKTINIEGTNFKYEIHYDQLNDTDLLMIEKYANHIFHAYQERYGLDVNTDYTFKGFIYNSLTDFRNARPGHNTAYAGTSFPHNSGSIAYDLTSVIESTLTLYNQHKRGIPYPKGRYTFIKDVEKELKAIRLDDNQEESNTAEKPETTIHQEKQEEPKRTEPSGSVEDEKSKVEEKKSGQEEISTEKHQTINQEESNTAEKPETTINQEEPKRTEPSGSVEDEKSKVEEKKSGQEEISTEKHQTINQEESNTAEKPETTIHQEKQEEPKRTEPSGSVEDEKIKLDEAKSSQEEISPEEHEVVLPNSKTINIEGTNFKYEIHYDQLNDTDLLMIEKYANHIFHAYQERYGLDVNTDYTFKGFIYNSLTDFRNARPGHNTAYAGTSFPHNSGSIAYDLTSVIESTLTLYNQHKRGIPYPKGRYTFIKDVEKELKAIRLDDNQEESNTAEKPETTIHQEKQEEPKRTEPSGSVEDEKSKVEEKKSGQEEISTEKHQTINQEESNTAEKPETTINQEEPKRTEPSGSVEDEKSKVEEKKSGQEEISTEKHQTINQEESNTAEKPETTINQEEPKRTEPSGSVEDEKSKVEEKKSGQEKISTEKHKVVLPHSKTINIEGTNFKYEIHYDQLNDKDLLTIEKYANYIFHAYQERYGLDMNTDHTVKGFIYNNLTDLRNACPEYNAGYATAAFHHYSHKSWSLAHNLTAAIYFTLSLYNKEKHGIPPNENYFIRNMAKELKAIRLDDNQEESNTAEKPETTINQKEQEESKKVESSGSGEEEKIKVEEAKSSQEEISTEKHQTINQEESNTAEKPETTINQEEPKRTEPSGSVEDEKSKVEEKKSGQEEISTEKHQTINQEESNTAEKSETTINQEEPKRTEPSGSVEDEKIKLDEAKSSQEEVSPETVLPYSKTINIEGTKFKYEIHYDQLDDKDLLTIEKYANHIFRAYQERYGLDISKDHTFRGFIYNNLADLRNAHPEYGTAHAGGDFHHYPHESEFIAHDLTAMIDFTLNLYNEKNSCIPYPEDAYTFIRDVQKELESIRLDDNQGESNTAEKPETTINQENQEEELGEQDVIISTDHPLDDYNHDYHLIG